MITQRSAGTTNQSFKVQPAAVRQLHPKPPRRAQDKLAQVEAQQQAPLPARQAHRLATWPVLQ